MITQFSLTIANITISLTKRTDWHYLPLCRIMPVLNANQIKRMLYLSGLTAALVKLLDLYASSG